MTSDQVELLVKDLELDLKRRWEELNNLRQNDSLRDILGSSYYERSPSLNSFMEPLYYPGYEDITRLVERYFIERLTIYSIEMKHVDYKNFTERRNDNNSNGLETRVFRIELVEVRMPSVCGWNHSEKKEENISGTIEVSFFYTRGKISFPKPPLLRLIKK